MDLSPPPPPNWESIEALSFWLGMVWDLVANPDTRTMRLRDGTDVNYIVENYICKIYVSQRGWTQEFNFPLAPGETKTDRPIGFICPETNRTIDILYFYDGAVISRPAYRRLDYRRSIHVLHLRNTAVSMLLRRQGAVWVPRPVALAWLQVVGPGDSFEAKALLDEEAAKQAARATRVALSAAREARRKARQARTPAKEARDAQRTSADPLSTLAGLAQERRARGMLQRPQAAALAAFAEGGLGGVGDLPENPPKARRAALEDHIKIDVRALNSRGLLTQGELTLVDLYWPQSTTDIDQVCLAIDMRTEEAEIRIAFDREASPVVQVLTLWTPMIRGRLRPLILCGRVGKLLEVLCYRSGLFAEPRFLKLTHRSQLS